jgi:sigma-B regulation protein RsbU (phosphoserine phosphatase)
VGGDWYDYIPLPGGRVAVVLGDVAGTGLAAALLMASTRSILRMYAEQGGPPGDVLAEVNRVLVADLPASKFVTMIYAVLDPARRTVTFANAGHLPPVLVDATGVHPIRVKSELPLGIREGTYSEHTLALPPGTRLFLYSDGVVEARDAAADEYGEDRLLRHVALPSASTKSLFADVLAHEAGQPAVDDITIAMVEATPAGAPQTTPAAPVDAAPKLNA